MPVHRWALRHLYKPVVRAGRSSLVASVVVFTLSAIFHEYLISVPLKMFRVWALVGMLMQIPLSIITSWWLRFGKKHFHSGPTMLGGGKLGNMIVWLSVILGQPLCILMYFHDWYLLTYPTEAMQHLQDVAGAD